MAIAKEAYESYLKEASKHIREKEMARQRAGELEHEIVSLRERIDGLKAKVRDLSAAAAVNVEAEADLESSMESMDALERKLALKQEVLERANEAASDSQQKYASMETEGRRLLHAYCVEEGKALLHDKRKAMEVAIDHLHEAYARWSYTGGSWDEFIAEVLPEPSSGELDALRRKFYESVLLPLERRYGA